MARKREGTYKRVINSDGLFIDKLYIAGKYHGSFLAAPDGSISTAAEKRRITQLRDQEGTAPETIKTLLTEYMADQEIKAQERERPEVFQKEVDLVRLHLFDAKFISASPKSVTTKMLQAELSRIKKKKRTRSVRDKTVRCGRCIDCLETDQAKAKPCRRGSRSEPTDQNVGRRTVEKVASRWSLFFDWCIREGTMAGPNPCAAIKLDPKPVSQNDGDLIIHLHETEANELLDWKELTAMQRAAYSLGILSGLRPGEIFALRWQDVRFDTHQIEVRRSWNRAVKNKNARRDIPMLPKLEEAMRAYRESQRTTRISGLVFPASDEPGNAATKTKLHKPGYTAGWADKRERRMKNGTKALVVTEGVRTRKGIRSEVAFKHFRHSCAHGLLQGWWGVELTLHDVSKWLGHSSTRVTETHYARWAKDSLQNRVTAQLYGVLHPVAKRV